MSFYERESWQGFKPNVIFEILTLYPRNLWPYLKTWGQEALPMPRISCSPGPARCSPTFFISPDVWSPFCFEIALHPGQSVSALARSHGSKRNPDERDLRKVHDLIRVSQSVKPYARADGTEAALLLLHFLATKYYNTSDCLCQGTVIVELIDI